MAPRKRYSVNHVHDGFKLDTHRYHTGDTHAEALQPTPSKSKSHSSTGSVSSTPSPASSTIYLSSSTNSNAKQKPTRSTSHTCKPNTLQKSIRSALVSPELLNETLQLSSLLIDSRKSMTKDFANPNYNSLDHSIKTHNIHELKTGGGKPSSESPLIQPHASLALGDTHSGNPLEISHESNANEFVKHSISAASKSQEFDSSESDNAKTSVDISTVQSPDYYLDQKLPSMNPVTHLPYNSAKLIIPSMATLNRVEKVKATFGSYYWYLNRYVAHNNSNSGELVWDPLEFIRIREGSHFAANNNNYKIEDHDRSRHSNTDTHSTKLVSSNHQHTDHKPHQHQHHNHPFVWTFTVDDIIASYHVHLSKITPPTLQRHHTILLPVKNNNSLTASPESKQIDITTTNNNTRLDNFHDNANQKASIQKIQEEPIPKTVNSEKTDSKSSNSVEQINTVGLLAPIKVPTSESSASVGPSVSALPTAELSNFALPNTTDSLPDLNINDISFLPKHAKATASIFPHHHLHMHHDHDNNAAADEQVQVPPSASLPEEHSANVSTPLSVAEKHRYRLIKSIPHHHHSHQRSSTASSSPSSSGRHHHRQLSSIHKKTTNGSSSSTDESSNSKKNVIVNSSLENMVVSNSSNDIAPLNTNKSASKDNLLPAFSRVHKEDTIQDDSAVSKSADQPYILDNYDDEQRSKSSEDVDGSYNGFEVDNEEGIDDDEDSNILDYGKAIKSNSLGLNLESLENLKETISHGSSKLYRLHPRAHSQSNSHGFHKSMVTEAATAATAAAEKIMKVKGANYHVNNSTPLFNSNVQKPTISVTSASPSKSGSRILDTPSPDHNFNGLMGSNSNLGNNMGNFNTNNNSDMFLSPNIKFTKIRANSSLGLRRVTNNTNSSSSSSTGSYLTPSNSQGGEFDGDARQSSKKKRRTKDGQKKKQAVRSRKKRISPEMEYDYLLSEIYNTTQLADVHLSVLDNHVDVVKSKYDSVFRFSKDTNLNISNENDNDDNKYIYTESEISLEMKDTSSVSKKNKRPSEIATASKQNEYLVDFISSLLPIYLDTYAKANENLTILKARLNSTQQSLKIEKLLSMSDRLILNLNTKIALNYKQISDKHKLILQNSCGAKNIWKSLAFKAAEYAIVVGLYFLWIVLSIVKIIWNIITGECFRKS